MLHYHQKMMTHHFLGRHHYKNLIFYQFDNLSNDIDFNSKTDIQVHSNLSYPDLRYPGTSLNRAALSTLVNMHCPTFKSIINHNSSNHYHVILFNEL